MLSLVGRDGNAEGDVRGRNEKEMTAAEKEAEPTGFNEFRLEGCLGGESR